MVSLIGEIVCTPSNPKIGESVLVEVQPATGSNFDPAIQHSIRINGVPGTRHYLQFTRPGATTIRVHGNDPQGATDVKSAIVQVQAPTTQPAATVPINAEPLIEAHPPSVSSHLWPEIGVPVLQVARLPQQPHKVGLAVGQTPQLALHPGCAKTLNSRSIHALPELQIPKVGEQALYQWDFGNGSTLGTMTPSVQHDFSNSINPLVEHQSFDVSVSSEGKKVTRTLTFTNLYAMLKRTRNELHPQATASGFATRTATGFTSFLTITNPEAQPITLTHRRFVPVPVSSTAIAVPTPIETLSPIISIPSKRLTILPVYATFAEIPRDSVGFSVYFSGNGASGETVRVSGHFDLVPSQRAHTNTLLSAGSLMETNAPLKIITDAMASRSLTSMTLSEARAANIPSLAAFEAARPQLSNQHHLLISGNAILDAIPPSPVTLSPPPSASPPVTVGAECDPDNIPDDLPPGMVCQATSETRTVMSAGRFMNARKGDVVLVPGGTGMIGGLLTHIQTPQYYSHIGIMTSDYDQITHCIAIDERMQAYPVGSIPTVGPEPTSGFRPDVVKYGWPGAVTQTVENSVQGEPRNDPEGGAAYNLQGFDASADGATIAGAWHITPPVVAKPDPMYETEELRQQLHVVADDAFNHTGKFHYRLYGYTDPTIADNTVAPADSGWASGTIPGVCSSFIWIMMKRNGMHLASADDIVKASDFSPAQIAAGAKVGPNTPDGLYLYAAAERAEAAQWLHDQIYNQAMTTIDQKAGVLGGIVEDFTNVAVHVSNEVLNAFTRDIVQINDVDSGWQHTVDANAVSPDNVMLWNGPSSNPPGPYGYYEPLVYREPQYDTVTVSKWRQVQLAGTLSGVVTFQGQPISGATITLYDGKSADSDNNGNYSMANVPYGTYIAKAQKEQDGEFLSANVNVDVESPSAALNIPLELPSDVFRTIIIDGTIHTHYTFNIIIETENKSNDLPFHSELRLGPSSTHAETTIENDVESAHAILKFTADWQVDKSVVVTSSFNLHDQTLNNVSRVPKDGTAGWSAQANADNDDANTTFTIRNTLTQS